MKTPTLLNSTNMTTRIPNFFSVMQFYVDCVMAVVPQRVLLTVFDDYI